MLEIAAFLLAVSAYQGFLCRKLLRALSAPQRPGLPDVPAAPADAAPLKADVPRTPTLPIGL